MTGSYQALKSGGMAALICAGLLFGTSIGAQAQNGRLQCPDGETWEVDKAALKQVVDNLPGYMSQREPVLLNLQALGAKSGELLITFTRRNLQCIADAYRNDLAGDGTVAICKRPNC